MKVKDAREYIRKYGEKYGWRVDEQNRLHYSPRNEEWNNFDIPLRAQEGDKIAVQLEKAVLTAGRQEIKNVLRRGEPDLETEFERKTYAEAKERVQKQQKRLRESSRGSKQIVLQNVFRESTDERSRYTPSERLSKEGIRTIAEKEANWAIGALQNKDFFQYLNYLTSPKIYAGISKLSDKLGLGIDFDSMVREGLKQYGDKYTAIEQSYLEVKAQVNDVLDSMSLSTEEIEELMSDGDIKELLLDVNYGKFFPDGI